jgi:hypothetical protein
VKNARGDSTAPLREAATLDRVHVAMLLQRGGQAVALRAMLEAETQRSTDFLRLANALSALYPKDSEEKAPSRCHAARGFALRKEWGLGEQLE